VKSIQNVKGLYCYLGWDCVSWNTFFFKSRTLLHLVNILCHDAKKKALLLITLLSFGALWQGPTHNVLSKCNLILAWFVVTLLQLMRKFGNN